jgi:hypothetical protein
MITEERQNARGEQDQRSSQCLPLPALSVYSEHDDSPQKAQPRDSRGLNELLAEFHREYAHWVRLIAKKVAIIATAYAIAQTTARHALPV